MFSSLAATPFASLLSGDIWLETIGHAGRNQSLEQLVSLPIFPGMDHKEVEYVIRTVKTIFASSLRRDAAMVL